MSLILIYSLHIVLVLKSKWSERPLPVMQSTLPINENALSIPIFIEEEFLTEKDKVKSTVVSSVNTVKPADHKAQRPVETKSVATGKLRV
jgi:hypothetical protein